MFPLVSSVMLPLSDVKVMLLAVILFTRFRSPNDSSLTAPPVDVMAPTFEISTRWSRKMSLLAVSVSVPPTFRLKLAYLAFVIPPSVVRLTLPDDVILPARERSTLSLIVMAPPLTSPS